MQLFVLSIQKAITPDFHRISAHVFDSEIFNTVRPTGLLSTPSSTRPPGECNGEQCRRERFDVRIDSRTATESDDRSEYSVRCSLESSPAAPLPDPLPSLAGNC